MQQSVCVLGLGYIGLPTASFLATKGCKVIGVDVSSQVVDTINRAEIHIVEPELDVLVRSAVHSGNLKAQTEPAAADVFFITVPTPIQSDRKPDLSYVQSASRAIAPFVEPGNLVILESTCPIGTTEDLVMKTLIEEGVDVDQGVLIAHCPERVLPGRILDRAGAERPHRRRHRRSLDQGRRRLLSPVRERRGVRDQCAPGRDDQAHREHVQGRQHRARQRAFDHLRQARHRRLGADQARQPPPPGSTSCSPAPASAAIASRSTPGSWWRARLNRPA